MKSSLTPCRCNNRRLSTVDEVIVDGGHIKRVKCIACGASWLSRSVARPSTSDGVRVVKRSCSCDEPQTLLSTERCHGGRIMILRRYACSSCGAEHATCLLETDEERTDRVINEGRKSKKSARTSYTLPQMSRAGLDLQSAWMRGR